MAFKDLFKTKAERRAYAKGRRDQYNKEHPKLKYAVASTNYHFKEDGSHLSKPYTSIPNHCKYATKREAQEALKRAISSEAQRKKRVLKAVSDKKVNVFDSYDCSYSDFKLVKINERKK